MNSKHLKFKPARFALLTLCALVGALPAHANYRAKAIEVTDFIQRSYYDEKEGLYRNTLPTDPKGLPYEVMWGNGVQFSVLAGAAKQEAGRYDAALRGFTKGLERYWDKDAPIPGFDAWFASRDGDDKYYDDNAWLVLGFAEANRVTKNPAYLKWARDTHTFVLSGWDEQLGGGLFWHQQNRKSKHTCVTAPAIVSAVALYEATGDKTDLDWARKIYDWTNAKLQDPADGLYWDNINLDGKIEKMKWTYNTALMIRANLDLARVTKEARYLKEARRVADAALARWVNPQSGAFGDNARFNHLLSEALLQTFEVTRDLKYLNAVRRNADFGYRYVRDARDGGYFNGWSAVDRPDDQRKELIETASAARVLWLLVPYLDTEELESRAQVAAKRGDTGTAINLFEQTLASTAGAAPTQKQG